MRLSSGRLPLATLAAIVSLTMLPGCSGTSNTPTPTTAPASTGTKHGAFGECLRAHGIADPPHNPAGPSSGGTPAPPPGVDQSTWDTAMQACGSLAPAPPQAPAQ
jgi:hypothetical protein